MDYAMKVYPMHFENGKTEWCVEYPDLKGCVGGGDTIEEALTHVKKQPIFVNVGRGTLMDSKVLEKALKEKIFSGAYIDVTDPEPLPKDSSLWNTNNLIITPHVTGGYHLEETLNRIVQISATNIQNYCEGKEIINRVNLEV